LQTYSNDDIRTIQTKLGTPAWKPPWSSPATFLSGRCKRRGVRLFC